MIRFGVWIHPGARGRAEAWGELCLSTVPDLQACMFRIMQERPGEMLVVDLRRIWFCDLAGLRSLWWTADHARTVGAAVEVRESASIARIGRLVEQIRVARTADILASGGAAAASRRSVRSRPGHHAESEPII